MFSEYFPQTILALECGSYKDIQPNLDTLVRLALSGEILKLFPDVVFALQVTGCSEG